MQGRRQILFTVWNCQVVAKPAAEGLLTVGRKMRISFIIPFTHKTGGIAVVLEYYRQLTAMGHEVNVFYPQLPYSVYLNSVPLREKISLLKQLLRPKRAIPHFTENIPVKPVIKINNLFIPNADAIIATAWPTAYDAAKLSPKKGRKFYFVQGYEIWHGHVSEVDNSYRLPLIITVEFTFH